MLPESFIAVAITLQSSHGSDGARTGGDDMDPDLGLALNFVLLGALLAAWFADAIGESRRRVRDCRASGGHHWRYGYLLEDRTLPHRWCTRCPAESPCLPHETDHA
jgi:hypothetical protein